MSGENQGPDLFFAGGECLTRFGVWVRRTDMDLEAATRETATRNSDAVAVGSDGILRTWEPDTPRAEWLNEVDLDPTRQLLDDLGVNMLTWTEFSDATRADDGTFSPVAKVTVITDADAGLSANLRLSLTGAFLTVADGDVLTASIFVKRVKTPGQPSCNLRLRYTGGLSQNFEVAYDPIADVSCEANETPDDFGVEKISGVWRRIWVTATVAGGNDLVELRAYPAARASGCGGIEGSGVGSTSYSAPMLEFGAGPPSTYQDIPRDTDRKFAALFLESTRTNGFTRSEELDDAVWSKVRSSVSANVDTAPDGTSTADKLVEDNTAANSHIFIRDTPALNDNNRSTVSVFAKAAERGEILLGMRDKSGNTRQIWFDLANGRIGSLAGGDAGQSGTMRALPNGWFRCTVEVNAATGATAPRYDCKLGSGGETEIYDGDGVSGVFFWGMDVAVNGGFPSSYIATVGATVTREVDEFFSAYPHPPIEMTTYSKFLESGSISFASRVYQIGNFANQAPRLLVNQNGGFYQIFHGLAAGNVTSQPSLSPEIGDLVEFRAVLFADGSVQGGISVNRSAEVVAERSAPNALADAWAGQFMHLNSSGASSDIGFIRLLAHKAHRGARSLDYMRAL